MRAMHTDTPHDTGPRARILDAARRIFLSEGFVGISTDRMARDAGVGKASIYKYFGGMEAILVAVLHMEGDSFPEPRTEDMETREAWLAALSTYGTEFLKFLNRPEILRFDHLLVEQSREHPDLARTIYDETYGRTLAQLARLIGHGRGRGWVDSKSGDALLAVQLMGLWYGVSKTRALLGLDEAPYRTPAKTARRGVEVLFGDR